MLFFAVIVKQQELGDLPCPRSLLGGGGKFLAASESAWFKTVSGASIVPFEIGKSLFKVNLALSAASDALSEAASTAFLTASWGCRE